MEKIFPEVKLIHDSSKEFYLLAKVGFDKFSHLETSLHKIQSVVVNFSFAIELMLKALYLKEENERISGHHLDKLYRNLSKDSKVYIEKEYQTELKKALKSKHLVSYKFAARKASEEFKEINLDLWNLEEVLLKHSRTFIDWRYLFEKGENRESYIFDMRAMTAFYFSVRTRFYQLQFPGFHSLQ